MVRDMLHSTLHCISPIIIVKIEQNRALYVRLIQALNSAPQVYPFGPCVLKYLLCKYVQVR